MDSIVGNMFYGNLDEDQVFPYPKLSQEQVEIGQEMVNAIGKFAKDHMDSEKFDQESKIPEEVMTGLAELGLCGLAVDEQFGGLELDPSLYSRVFQEIAGIDGSTATMLGAHQSIGYKALLNEGTEEQKAKWLPKLASGEVFAAFALTEPGSGSDAYSIKTRATDNADGTYTITGQKLWITNAGKAGFYTVFCKTEHEVDGAKKDKISCFIVEKEREGVSFGEPEKKMGIKASETRAVYFDKVIIPKENILGELGRGFKIAMNVLNTGRLSLGSGSVGGMKSILKLATAHAKNRKQFGSPLSEFGIIQHKLAKMAASIYACESIVYLTTGRINKGCKEFYLESAICKVFCSENLWNTVDQAMQIAAGNGYMKEYPYERMMRDARINLIFEGTNEILRIFIALSGIKEPSERLKELGKVADVSTFLKDPIKSLGVLSSFAKGRIFKMVGTKTLTKINPALEEYASGFSTMLNEFSIKVENTIMKYGRKIIGNQMPQYRIANMVIELYVQIATLSRTTAILENEGVSDEDKDYVNYLTEIICKDSKRRFYQNSRRISGSFDSRIPSVSEEVVKRDGYGLDILNF